MAFSNFVLFIVFMCTGISESIGAIKAAIWSLITVYSGILWIVCWALNFVSNILGRFLCNKKLDWLKMRKEFFGRWFKKGAKRMIMDLFDPMELLSINAALTPGNFFSRIFHSFRSDSSSTTTLPNP
jgi:hypothetical protein